MSEQKMSQEPITVPPEVFQAFRTLDVNAARHTIGLSTITEVQTAVENIKNIVAELPETTQTQLLAFVYDIFTQPPQPEIPRYHQMTGLGDFSPPPVTQTTKDIAWGPALAVMLKVCPQQAAQNLLWKTLIIPPPNMEEVILRLASQADIYLSNSQGNCPRNYLSTKIVQKIQDTYQKEEDDLRQQLKEATKLGGSLVDIIADYLGIARERPRQQHFENIGDAAEYLSNVPGAGQGNTTLKSRCIGTVLTTLYNPSTSFPQEAKNRLAVFVRTEKLITTIQSAMGKTLPPLITNALYLAIATQKPQKAWQSVCEAVIKIEQANAKKLTGFLAQLRHPSDYATAQAVISAIKNMAKEMLGPEGMNIMKEEARAAQVAQVAQVTTTEAFTPPDEDLGISSPRAKT